MPTNREWFLVFFIYGSMAVAVIGGLSILIFWLVTR